MITLEQAKNLKHGDILLCNGARWKVNGKVKTWIRSPERVKVPLKYGLRTCTYLTENTLDVVTLEK
jgi:hypothetical protein